LKIALGSDHRGIGLKFAVMDIIHWKFGDKFDMIDCGPSSLIDVVDYPDFAKLVCEKVISGEVDRGILVCGSGIGMSMAANKFPGIRAALVKNKRDAAWSRQHNDSNVLCLSADPDSIAFVEIWLQTDFEGGRHERRIEKIDKHAKLLWN